MLTVNIPLCLLSSPSLSFSPFFHFTHLQPERLRKEMESQAQLSLAPRRQAFKTSIFPSGVVPGHQPTCLPNSNYNRGSASGNGGDHRHWRLRKKKRQRQKHAHNWQQFTRAQFPGGRVPAKFGCQPIKLEQYLLAHAYPANYVRVHFRHLGV